MSGDEAGAGDREEGFEEAVEALERVVRRLDREEMALDEAMELFEAGVGHLRRASTMLDEARGRVDELVEDAAGDLEFVEFEMPEGEEGDGADG